MLFKTSSLTLLLALAGYAPDTHRTVEPRQFPPWWENLPVISIQRLDGPMALELDRTVTLQDQIRFRSDEALPYHISELVYGRYPGRAETGEILAFTGDYWNAADSIAIMPYSNEGNLTEAPIALPACAPEIADYRPVFLADTLERDVNLGIWVSLAEPRRTKVAVYAGDFRCGAPRRDERYRVLVSSAIPWRLAGLQFNLHLPPSLILLSDAAVGEPLTFAVFNLRRGVFSFRDRRPPR